MPKLLWPLSLMALATFSAGAEAQKVPDKVAHPTPMSAPAPAAPGQVSQKMDPDVAEKTINALQAVVGLREAQLGAVSRHEAELTAQVEALTKQLDEAKHASAEPPNNDPAAVELKRD